MTLIFCFPFFVEEKFCWIFACRQYLGNTQTLHRPFYILLVFFKVIMFTYMLSCLLLHGLSFTALFALSCIQLTMIFKRWRIVWYVFFVYSRNSHWKLDGNVCIMHSSIAEIIGYRLIKSYWLVMRWYLVLGNIKLRLEKIILFPGVKWFTICVHVLFDHMTVNRHQFLSWSVLFIDSRRRAQRRWWRWFRLPLRCY